MTGQIRSSLLYHLIASFPVVTFAVLFLLTKLARINRIHWPWKLFTVCLLAALIVSAIAYLCLPILFDDAESGVAGASIQAMRGLPIYPAPFAAERYGLVYGPIASLWHVPFYLLFGKSLFSFKLAGVLAFLLILVGLYRICRKYAGPAPSLLGLGCASLLLFQYIGYDFWGRTDPLILLLVTASILVTIDSPDWAVVLVAAVTVGALPNLKISAITYLLPLLGLVWKQRSLKIALAAVGSGAVLMALPFGLPQVSLTNYLFLINVVKNQGFSLDFLSRNIQYTLIFIIPLILLPSPTHASSSQKTYFGLTLLGMAGTCVLGSKIGAGNYHLLPYLVPLLHLYFWRRSELPAEQQDLAASRFAIPLAATLLFYSTAHLLDYANSYRFLRRGAVVISEIKQVESTYRGQSVEVGIGDTSDAQLSYGPVAAFDGQPYTINLQSVRDTQLGGVPLPQAAFDNINNCGINIWLISKGQIPFAATNAYYESAHPAFSDTFRNDFMAHYRKVASLTEFDVWQCAAQ